MVFYISIFVSLNACTLVTPRYGIGYNSDRQKLGLPTIPATWTVDARFDESIWYNPEWQRKYDDRIPVHASKYVSYRNGTLLLETDEYYGKNDWSCEESICREQLFITYCYQADNQCNGEDGWFVIYMSNESKGFGKEFISMKEAMIILDEWDLSYP